MFYNCCAGCAAFAQVVEQWILLSLSCRCGHCVGLCSQPDCAEGFGEWCCRSTCQTHSCGLFAPWTPKVNIVSNCCNVKLISSVDQIPPGLALSSTSFVLLTYMISRCVEGCLFFKKMKVSSLHYANTVIILTSSNQNVQFANKCEMARKGIGCVTVSSLWSLNGQNCIFPLGWD